MLYHFYRESIETLNGFQRRLKALRIAPKVEKIELDSSENEDDDVLSEETKDKGKKKKKQQPLISSMLLEKSSLDIDDFSEEIVESPLKKSKTN